MSVQSASAWPATEAIGLRKVRLKNAARLEMKTYVKLFIWNKNDMKSCQHYEHGCASAACMSYLDETLTFLGQKDWTPEGVREQPVCC